MSNGFQMKLLKHSFGLVLLIFQYPLPGGYITATAVQSTSFFHRENTARSFVFFFFFRRPVFNSWLQISLTFFLATQLSYLSGAVLDKKKCSVVFMTSSLQKRKILSQKCSLENLQIESSCRLKTLRKMDIKNYT